MRELISNLREHHNKNCMSRLSVNNVLNQLEKAYCEKMLSMSALVEPYEDVNLNTDHEVNNYVQGVIDCQAILEGNKDE